MSLEWFLVLCWFVVVILGALGLHAQSINRMGNVTISSATGEPMIRIVCNPEQLIALAVELDGKTIHELRCTTP